MVDKRLLAKDRKLRRKCTLMKVAMNGFAVLWLGLFDVGCAFLGVWADDRFGITTSPLMAAISIVLAFVAAAIALTIAILIAFPFHNKLEQYREELLYLYCC